MSLPVAAGLASKPVRYLAFPHPVTIFTILPYFPTSLLSLALFTLAIAAGNKGFLAIGDWISSYREPLIDLFQPPKNRLPT